MKISLAAADYNANKLYWIQNENYNKKKKPVL